MTEQNIAELESHLDAAGFYHKTWENDDGVHFVHIQSFVDAEHDTYYTGRGDTYAAALSDACAWVDEWILSGELHEDDETDGNGG